MSVSLPGRDELMQTTDMPGAQRTHSVYFASLLLSCYVQSVAGVQSGRRVKKKILKANWSRYLYSRSSWDFLAKRTEYSFQGHWLNRLSTSSSITKCRVALGRAPALSRPGSPSQTQGTGLGRSQVPSSSVDYSLMTVGKTGHGKNTGY